MALRRRVLLALVVCALAHARAGRRGPAPAPAPPRRDASSDPARRAGAVDDDYSSEAPYDPFDEWDYESSEEPEVVRPKPERAKSPSPQKRTTPRPSGKVAMRGKVPKVTVKEKRPENRKNTVKTTTIDIESFTKFIVTKKPMEVQERRPQKPSTARPQKPSTKRAKNPSSSVRPPKASPVRPQKASTGRPQKTTPKRHQTKPLPVENRHGATSRRPRPAVAATSRPHSSGKPSHQTTKRRGSTTRAPTRSTRAPRRTPRTTRAPARTTRAPARTTRTTSAPPRTTRRPARTTRHPPRPPKTTVNPHNKNKDGCPKRPGWLASFFEANSKIINNEESGTKPGFIKNVYNWFGWDSKEAEIGESTSWMPSFFQTAESEQPATTSPATTTAASTTTASPATATSDNWFYSLINSEEDDGAYVTNTTENNPKKSLRKRYNGYQLLRTFPEAAWKIHELLDLQEETQGSGIMWWTTPSINSSTDILIPPDLLADMKDHLDSLGLEYDVVIWDLQKAIMYENPKLSKKQRVELEQIRGHPLTWRRYHRYADILRYLEYLQHSNPDIVDLVPLGRSSEGLPLVAVKVSFPSNDSRSEWSSRGADDSAAEKEQTGNKRWRLRSRMKPSVWIEAGAHAREWISPAAATWMLHALVEGEKGLGADYEMLKAADWYIVPVLNPDGYEHSHTHDRLWRKTRSRHVRDNNYYNSWFPWNWGRTDCVGVDVDRNYDFHWGEKGSSKDACSEQFAGPHPFSEPETRAVSQFLLENKERMKVYISLHSYSQMWVVPSTHSRIPFSDDGEILEMGKLATAALADVFGTKYQVGTMTELAQPVTGAAYEWAKGRAGIKYSYNIKMRDSYGPYGFLLPGSQIVPTAKETWVGIKTIADNL